MDGDRLRTNVVDRHVCFGFKSGFREIALFGSFLKRLSSTENGFKLLVDGATETLRAPPLLRNGDNP